MKKLILTLLLVSPLFAQAQYYEAAALGVGLASAAFKKKPQDPQLYVTSVTYQGQQFSQKRTPADKLKSKAGTAIAQVEQLLQAAWQRVQASPTVPALEPVQARAVEQAIAELQQIQPTWSILAYQLEMSFYQSEDYRRSQLRNELTRQHQRRANDSLQQVRVLAARRTDSLHMVVYRRQKATADSIRRAEQHEAALASPYRYINAAELIMRASPTATAARRATLGGGSAVELLQAGSQWSQVKASDRIGYVPTASLVLLPNEVAPEYVDQQMVRLVGRQYTSVSWEDDTSASTANRTPSKAKKAAPTNRPVAAGPAAYYCNSGNTVKYHSSPTCRGLTRCGASVVRISLREAEQSMEPCKFCH